MGMCKEWLLVISKDGKISKEVVNTDNECGVLDAIEEYLRLHSDGSILLEIHSMKLEWKNPQK